MSGDGAAWRPTADLAALKLRARVLAELRAFFAERGGLEVESPLLGQSTASDVHIASFECTTWGRRRFLQTSPEYAMKRLLAAGSGAIYQICKAFRVGEQGRRHNPEFTMLEWYRPGWDHHRLMDEVEQMLSHVLGTGAAQRSSYRQALLEHIGVDPLRADAEELRRRYRDLASGLGQGLGPSLGASEVAGLAADDRDGWLDLLVSTVVEPKLGRGRPTFLYDYPPEQAALARLRGSGGEAVAERFEVYVEGVELANGYHELCDGAEQRRRFEIDRARRAAAGLPAIPLDERLLAALDAGLPDCAGVSIGVDRLLMLAAGASSLDEVLAFPADRA